MFQIGSGSRGDVTILPTLVINNVQYRGRSVPANICIVQGLSVCLQCDDTSWGLQGS